MSETRIPAILRRKRKADWSPTSSSVHSDSEIDYDEGFGSSPSVSHHQGQKVVFRLPVCLPTPVEDIQDGRLHSPLPRFSWADPIEVWRLMLLKDSSYVRNYQSMTRHPTLHCRMRSILLDWLMEVCEVYKLHRETFYLAQDFIDRFLATQLNVPKQQLQLLGITALFIAAKIEEIYPPKLGEFAYVTDEACTEREIVDKELVILKILNWDLTPMTVNNWLNVYMQVNSSSEQKKKNCSNEDDDFVFPQYSGEIFIQVAQICDLCILDMNSLQFSYGVLAASALYLLSDQSASSLASTGFQLRDIENCVEWMKPFVLVLQECGFAEMKTFKKISEHEMHSIQTHNVDLKLLEKVHSKRSEMALECCYLMNTPRSNRRTTRSVQLAQYSPVKST